MKAWGLLGDPPDSYAGFLLERWGLEWRSQRWTHHIDRRVPYIEATAANCATAVVSLIGRPIGRLIAQSLTRIASTSDRIASCARVLPLNTDAEIILSATCKADGEGRRPSVNIIFVVDEGREGLRCSCVYCRCSSRCAVQYRLLLLALLLLLGVHWARVTRSAFAVGTLIPSNKKRELRTADEIVPCLPCCKWLISYPCLFSSLLFSRFDPFVGACRASPPRRLPSRAHGPSRRHPPLCTRTTHAPFAVELLDHPSVVLRVDPRATSWKEGGELHRQHFCKSQLATFDISGEPVFFPVN